ncbi:type II secretion system F family protein [Halodesulfovibrio aestuarii]|uniref:type II secretion system F family protein n=1 Tax=Halodesulfovibrio aestuarii TaxID=126333 RepID=UPI003D358D65
MWSPDLNLKLAVLLSFRHNTRRNLYEKISAMVRNGLGLEATLLLLQKRAAKRNSWNTIILREAHSRMLTGGTLATAFEGNIPDEEYMLIKSGVDSGEIPHSLELCSKLIKQKQKIKTAVQEAISYPALMLSLLTLLLLVVSRFVVPQLGLISDPSTWNGEAALLYQVSRFIDSPAGIIILGAMFCSMIAVFATLPTFTGKVRVVCDRFPPWSIYRLIHGAIWLFTLATLLRASVQLNTILEDTMNSSQSSAWLKERLKAVHAQLAIGKNLGQALADSGYQFPDKDLIEDLYVYASLPGFHERLYSIAEEWMAAGIERIKQICKLINLILMLNIGMFTGLIILSINSFQQQLGNIAG